MGRLEGKVALVTGGSGDLGKAMCLRLAQDGASVVTCSRREPDTLSDLMSAISEVGPEGLALQGDVTDSDSVKSVVNGVVEARGRLDILVNNAGITDDTLILRMKLQQWDTVISTNLTALFTMTQAAVRPMMKNRWGRIINISSIVGQIGNVGQANYSAAKAGIFGLTKTVAREFAARGITANAVAPGFIDSRMTNTIAEDLRSTFIDSVPLKRPGTSEEVAYLVAFLASDEASYITGQVINVDGGLVM